MNKHVLILFLDGVGIGSEEPERNPFCNAQLPTLTQYLDVGWPFSLSPRICEQASLIPTDATLGVDGIPQSATGQATIITGKNMPSLLGEHWGPWPNGEIRRHLTEGNLFNFISAEGGTVALLNAYPQAYFDAISRRRRSYSVFPFIEVSSGQGLFTESDLRAGRAISPNFTNKDWRDQLKIADLPLLTTMEAGQHIAALAQEYTFSFIDHWPTDHLGHRGPMSRAIKHLEHIDQVLAGILSSWDHKNGLLIITSDHGNIEDLSQRRHTTNPVPTILFGQAHAHFATQITDLTDIATVVKQFLGYTLPT
ncbi:MAG: hypothetical protein ACPG8W_18695 [Candidatus Promineifilaceae bacterium]